MEIQKHEEKPLEFKWRDVIFKVKPRANSGDRLAVFMRDQRTTAGYSLTLVERMVVDWEGVTQDGKPVPYSFQLLAEHMPSTMQDNALVALADFIYAHTDIAKGVDEGLKKK